ncbi:peptidase [Crocosphaera sp. XPORK-15E]|uniref:peptidase n=1 Tax=Crocosphaera sp. XPORK-15E TaxID=3110247 RepID=UPI002B214530|nr:peptidase [Crocosphaera sp. XPORK-15E]MEA5532768.1 peptidase [Crocosphaera sp. XPORK-15E]
MQKYNMIITQLFKKKISLFSVNLWLVISVLLLTITPVHAVKNDLKKLLPPLQIHPLPITLNQWQNSNNQGDYFEQIKPTLDGYLIWSEFPIKVYFDRPSNPDDTAAVTRRFNQWVTAVEQAITEWNIYLSMIEVSDPNLADIIIKRNDPPLDKNINPETGQLQIPRARTAQTRYEFYIKNKQLFHQMTIQISPRLGELSLLSAARHELGHALGIWGHSLQETDALYFSQVGNPPPISPRDINTLKKIYEQPTRLGWPLPSQS